MFLIYVFQHEINNDAKRCQFDYHCQGEIVWFQDDPSAATVRICCFLSASTAPIETHSVCLPLFSQHCCLGRTMMQYACKTPWSKAMHTERLHSLNSSALLSLTHQQIKINHLTVPRQFATWNYNWFNEANFIKMTHLKLHFWACPLGGVTVQGQK